MSNSGVSFQDRLSKRLTVTGAIDCDEHVAPTLSHMTLTLLRAVPKAAVYVDIYIHFCLVPRVLHFSRQSA